MGRSTGVLGVLLMLAVLLLAACSSATASVFVPAGMAQGQPTFLYLFTEN